MNVGLVFGAIAAVIMMAFLFVFAVPQFGALFGIGGQAQLQNTIKDIEAMSNEMYLMAKGSTRLATIHISSDSIICFVDPDDPSPVVWLQTSRNWDPQPIVVNLLNDPNNQNYGSTIWFYRPGDELGEGYKISKLMPAPRGSMDPATGLPQPGSFCITGSTELYFESQGTHVEVSPA